MEVFHGTTSLLANFVTGGGDLYGRIHAQDYSISGILTIHRTVAMQWAQKRVKDYGSGRPTILQFNVPREILVAAGRDERRVSEYATSILILDVEEFPDSYLEALYLSRSTMAKWLAEGEQFYRVPNRYYRSKS